MPRVMLGVAAGVGGLACIGQPLSAASQILWTLLQVLMNDKNGYGFHFATTLSALHYVCCTLAMQLVEGGKGGNGKPAEPRKLPLKGEWEGAGALLMSRKAAAQRCAFVGGGASYAARSRSSAASVAIMCSCNRVPCPHIPTF